MDKAVVVSEARDGQFIMPVPGQGLAASGSLVGHKAVLTGIFPQAGGGQGLNLGKQRVKEMIQSFGGQVMGSVSGATTLLVVGKEPGMSKVSKASDRGVRMIRLEELAASLHTGELKPADPSAPPLQITNFSMGFKTSRGYNGLALRLEGSEARPQIKGADYAPESLCGNSVASHTCSFAFRYSKRPRCPPSSSRGG
mmetsp:Transcript_7999/g.22651  ORF Transcript_7999/g.22651 Transcript_7999/m.22651 type:complete len:197 (+) Transcript_7999:918-1508(+)